MNAQVPAPPTPQTQNITYSMDEFFRLSARCQDNPEQVQAIAALFQARMINFKMAKELLQLGDLPVSSTTM
jgi:hypothetical protein